MIFVPILLAVHDTGAFELDGDAVSLNVPEDWDDIYNAVVNSGSTAAVATSFTADKLLADGTESLNATIFTGGGSKDGIDINQWAWKDGAGGLPDKDNLLHSFAARYSLTPTDPASFGTGTPPPAIPPNSTVCFNGTGDLNRDGSITAPEVAFNANKKCEVLYFGSDRYDNSGDAQQGFWFFQNAISLGTNKIGGGSGFKGVHKTGDLLIISDFSNGGTTSTISVYVWDTSVSGNLKLLQTSAAANCATASAGDAFCGIVNGANGTSTGGWTFTDKSNLSTYLNGEFYEGGVNLTQLGLGDECFASVGSETRSSTSTTATLKDFVLGGFGKCTATLSTQVSNAGPVAPGTGVHDTLTVTSSNPSKTASGTVTWFLCKTSTGACSSGGDNIGTSTLSGSGGTATTNSATVNTSTLGNLTAGRYCFRAEWPGDSNFADGPYAEFGGENGTNECFTVRDTSSISTAQKWLPQDTATVSSSGGTISGTVVFSLYENGDCTGTAATTFTDTTADAQGGFETNNSTYYTSSKTISWSAVFTPTDSNAMQGSTTTRCEKSVLTITNSSSDFPPPGP
ncbi:MAG TPA: hypothetical protein VFU28_14820 [Vicinamibacterales bacterium]|nr:hypothetical protein [Vicinamibacterales bacterium]